MSSITPLSSFNANNTAHYPYVVHQNKQKTIANKYFKNINNAWVQNIIEKRNKQ